MHGINLIGRAQLYGRIPIERVIDDATIEQMCRIMRQEVLKKVPSSADRIKVRWMWSVSGKKLSTPGFAFYPTWMAIFSLGNGYEYLLITLEVQWTDGTAEMSTDVPRSGMDV